MDPRTLQTALALLRAPDTEVLPRLSAALAGPVPHSWAAAQVAGRVRTRGCVAGGAEPTTAELADLADRIPSGTSWSGRAVLGGEARHALAVVPGEPAAAGCVLVLADAPDTAAAHAVARDLWEIAVVRFRTLVSVGPTEPPMHLAASRAAAGEYAKDLRALNDRHAATLTAVLGALRSRRLGDAAAREVALSLASSALTGMRCAPVTGERVVGEAFDSMAERLRVLARHSGFHLEPAPPQVSDRLLPPEVAEGAHAMVRGCVLGMLERTGPSRIRVGWELEAGQLVVNVRDDGDGALFPQSLAEYRLRERLAGFGGDFAVEAVPGWGTSVTARFPLARQPAPIPGVLDGLTGRELDVLTEVARGRGNREIATRLLITEHTVKFHVANILAKLGVRSRGEAAAAARAAHL
ncbi:LuxR C-terminal-related transcriptional regulator [Streptomyces sp. NPDC020298]|uniref:LuxR C-terminal-related transcriptional regulator n=1 Tax=unclassified Streptomyces TaxID=2593676 RepID=UPI0033D93277